MPWLRYSLLPQILTWPEETENTWHSDPPPWDYKDRGVVFFCSLLSPPVSPPPLSPFILISNTRERLHHVFWLSCPKWQQRHLPQSNGAPASCKVKHGNIKFRDLENKMFLWQRCPRNLPLAQTWKLLLERILHLIARINSDHNYQHQWIAARFNT